MNKEEQNIKVHGFIDGGCWHEFINLNYTQCKCVNCNKIWYDLDSVENPDYLTMNGIGLIKEFMLSKKRGDLVSKTNNTPNMWEHFKRDLFDKICDPYYDLMDYATDPEKFIPKFIEYMEKD